MADLQTQIASRFRDALRAAFGDTHADTDPLIRLSGDPKFGDFQANVAMSLAKSLGQKPRDVAGKIVENLQKNGLFEKVEIAGPGFINLTLTPAALAEQAEAMLSDERLGVPKAAPPQTIVVDYSAPNVAKEMHIGHLRSTGIGDAIARVLRFLGHRVIGQNHLGDWGTQFGILIQDLVERHPKVASGDSGEGIGDLNTFYQSAKQRFDSDPEFADRARKRVVALQSGDADTLRQWNRLVELSKKHFEEVYRRLDIDTTHLEYRGESAYNDQLKPTVEALRQAGQLKESEGAQVVYPEGAKGREGEPKAMIVQKSDGGFGYAATDLAAARHRVTELKADRAIYVTDARQRDHFAEVFQTVRQAGWAPPNVRFDHVPFGTILGSDRKPFKTRSGGTVRLIEVLDEAESRAEAIVAEKSPELPEAERKRIAHVVGIGALKYADLSSERIKDYVFDWDRMLALEGNTAPYLQNAYVRIRSIFRKAATQGLQTVSSGPIEVREPAERQLVLKLLQFPQVIAGVADSLEPHRLTNYLYELAASFHAFYEHCPVLTAPDDATRQSRLRLCELTARTLRTGLDLLGIGVVEQM